MSIAVFQALLFRHKSLGISYSLKYLFIVSPHVNFGLPLPLLILLSWLRTPQCTGAFEGLLWTWPNHLNRCWTSFSSICATPRQSWISSFRTRSIPLRPSISNIILKSFENGISPQILLELNLINFYKILAFKIFSSLAYIYYVQINKEKTTLVTRSTPKL
jgi:hypothetical protein